MYTQCPHCQTMFQVTSAQLKAAQGMVRCGSCHRIFNSLPRLVENLPEMQDKGKSEPGKVTAGDIPVVESEEIFEEIEITDPSIPTAEPRQPAMRPDNAPTGQPIQTKENRPAPAAMSQKTLTAVAPPPPPPAQLAASPIAMAVPSSAVTNNSITLTLRQTNDPKKLEASRRALHERLAKTKSKLLANRQQSVPYAQTEEAFFNSIISGTELINASASDVAPADLRFGTLDGEYDVEKYAHPPAAMPTPSAHSVSNMAVEIKSKSKPAKNNTFIWTGAILGLMVLVVFQYAFFIKEDLVKYPSMRPLFKTICGIVACEPLMFDATKLKIIANLDYHPDNPGALQIHVKVYNQAELTQHFPVLELVLRDGKDQHVELFYPVQYLSNRGQEKKGIPAEKHFETTLTIVNPFHGKETLSYQINALRNDT